VYIVTENLAEYFLWYNRVMINLQEIKKQIKGEVSVSKTDLEKYSRDASIFKVMPEVVVHPKNIEDLKNLVTWVSENKDSNPFLSLTARSAGTCMSGGSINDSIILDFTTHFNKILEIENLPEIFTAINESGKNFDGYAVVEPGVYYRDFEKQTLNSHLILPCYTASKSLNTVGGMVGNNSAGEKTLAFGQTNRYVEELKAVLSDGNEYTFGPLTETQLEQKLKLSTFEGELYRKMYRLISENYEEIQKAKPSTSKNSAGYYLWNVWNKKVFDLTQLLVGSQGTLGLVTKIKFGLVRPKPKAGLLVVFLDDLTRLGDLVTELLKFKPESLESFDDHTFSLAVKFLPGMIKRMKGNLIKLAFQFLPEVFMVLTGGMPKLILICEFTGQEPLLIQKTAEQAQKMVDEKFGYKCHITKNESESEKYWTVRRESFSLLREHTHGLHTAPFVDDIVVHPKDLPEFLPRLNEIFAKYPSLVYTIAGHAGDANFHIIPLMDFKDPSQRAIIPKLSDEVYNLVLEYKGSITAEHNDGLIRTPYLEKMFGVKMVSLFAETKKIFDPLNIFNPRKKVGATVEYAQEHMIRE
jgi:FAD/FMN-containing dehydrogenase